MLGAFEACPAEIGFQQPSLIEDRPVELGIGKLRLVELGGTQDSAGEVEAGQIETGKLPASKIDRMWRCRRGDRSFDVCAAHFRRCHLGEVTSTCRIMSCAVSRSEREAPEPR